MYSKVIYKKSTVTSVKVFEAERIEDKVKRIINNQEPITDGAPIIYTEKGKINPNFDHRTDRWEIATENMDIVHKDKTVKADGVPLSKVGEEVQEEAINNSEGTTENAGDGPAGNVGE